MQALDWSRFLFPKKSTKLSPAPRQWNQWSSHSQSYRDLLKEKTDVWAVGPGLGKSRAAEILELIEKAKQPMVIDADGLNILAEKISTLKHCKGKRLLTPHPGEMKRLSRGEKETRAKTATKFCHRFPVTLLLKGSRTIVAERDRPLSYNTTGNPGMATGGMGDILTGVCAGLAGTRSVSLRCGATRRMVMRARRGNRDFWWESKRTIVIAARRPRSPGHRI